MRKTLVLFLGLWMLLLWVAESHSATLMWDAQPAGSGSIIVERGDSPTGPFSLVATLPEGTRQFILTPGAWGHYRPRNTVAPGNTAQYSSDLYTGFLADRVDIIGSQLITLESKLSAIEMQIVALEAPEPAPASNFTVRIIDLDHIEIVGTNCASLSTNGSGTRRVMECKH